MSLMPKINKINISLKVSVSCEYSEELDAGF
jgi:hypothetical protein